MNDRDDFRAVFRRATGHDPYAYQEALAARELPPPAIEVPTGAGKTFSVLIPWLCSPEAPRRLVYALPMRSLVEQTAEVVRGTFDRLGEAIPVHVLMGGADPASDWRLDADGRAVIVGTIDMLLSRALNRGYAESRFAWPVSFGLLNNDCRWVFDEVQLMGPARTTSAQLDGLRAKLGTLLPCQTIWMSATLDTESLRTFDRPELGDVVRLEESDRSGALAKRLHARKSVERVDVAGLTGTKLATEVAAAVAERHRPGTRSIVVVNRVELAQQVQAALAKRLSKQQDPPELVLLHSRFRPPDRARLMQRVLADPGAAGSIIVSTQVIEAGIDLSSALLATETAPFSSIVQRAGRCNRAGEHEEATLLWLDRGVLDAKTSAPYDPEDLTSAREALEALLGDSASPSRLERLEVSERRTVDAVLRRRDLLDLFDTAPDLSGSNIDVAPFIRPDDERTVSVFFRDLQRLTRHEIETQERPGRDELVSIPIGSAPTAGLRSFDIVDGRWVQVARPAPGSVLMLDASSGGYNAEQGWTGKAGDRPEPLDPLVMRSPESIGSDQESEDLRWVGLTRHLTDVEAAAHQVLERLSLSDTADGKAVLRAAALHDWGKAHPAFQEFLLAGAAEEERNRLTTGLWAKSAHRGGRHVRPHFRHELATAMALHGREADLVRYLTAAHHGRVRCSIRPAPEEVPPDGDLDTRFALGIVEGDALPAIESPLGTCAATRLTLAEMELGGAGRSWTEMVAELRDTHGPFALAFLEGLLRIADWRASA